MVNRNFTPENLAWAAGFFDGEGCSILRPRYWHEKAGKTFGVQPYLSVAQVDTEVLEKFQSIFGVGKIGKPYVSSNPKRRPCSQYSVAGHPTFQYVIAALWKYLGSVKRAQAKDVLDRWRVHNDALHGASRVAEKGIAHVRALRASGMSGPAIEKMTGLRKDLVYHYCLKRKKSPGRYRTIKAFDTPYFNSL